MPILGGGGLPRFRRRKSKILHPQVIFSEWSLRVGSFGYSDVFYDACCSWWSAILYPQYSGYEGFWVMYLIYSEANNINPLFFVQWIFWTFRFIQSNFCVIISVYNILVFIYHTDFSYLSLSFNQYIFYSVCNRDGPIFNFSSDPIF